LQCRRKHLRARKSKLFFEPLKRLSHELIAPDRGRSSLGSLKCLNLIDRQLRKINARMLMRKGVVITARAFGFRYFVEQRSAGPWRQLAPAAFTAATDAMAMPAHRAANLRGRAARKAASSRPGSSRASCAPSTLRAASAVPRAACARLVGRGRAGAAFAEASHCLPEVGHSIENATSCSGGKQERLMGPKVTRNGRTSQFRVEYSHPEHGRIQAIVTSKSFPFPDSIPVKTLRANAAKKAIRALGYVKSCDGGDVG
jgi:hypothetical protein